MIMKKRLNNEGKLMCDSQVHYTLSIIKHKCWRLTVFCNCKSGGVLKNNGTLKKKMCC